MSTGSRTPDVLERILEVERVSLVRRRGKRSSSELRSAPGWGLGRRSLAEALQSRSPAVIAECKRRSPSKGVLRDPFDPVAIARAYASAGAAGISVLTNEEFFGGSLSDLERVREVVELPLLRKDFVFDPYQIEEARAAGADAVLLICAMLDRVQLRDLSAVAADLGLEVLVEVHDEDEVERALDAGAELVGVNNRDLRSFRVDLATTERLAPAAVGRAVVVGESGIATAADVERLRRVGVDAFLVGEAFMRAEDPGQPLRELIEGSGSDRSKLARGAAPGAGTGVAGKRPS